MKPENTIITSGSIHRNGAGVNEATVRHFIEAVCNGCPPYSVRKGDPAGSPGSRTAKTKNDCPS